MRITAAHIHDWSDTREAQGLLPILLRRLIHAGAAVTLGDFPGGDSVSSPGWDGVLATERGTAWVPTGPSFWEVSCNKDVRRKVESDYEKRTSNTPAQERTDATFVFVSSRRWSGKSDWESSKAAAGDWGAVRVYNADDLEQWLEQVPAVALWFAEQLGIAGEGIESIDQWWDRWTQQVSPPLSAPALIEGRERGFKDLVTGIGAERSRVWLCADSTEEAVTFTIAALMTTGDAPDRRASAVVTSEAGWRFVRANPALSLVICARPELFANAAVPEQVKVVVPLGRDAGSRVDEVIVIDRPTGESFSKGLVSLGLDRFEAERLARATGRSWAVFRRLQSSNPAVASPCWRDSPAGRALTTFCLVGVFSSGHEADKEVIASIAGRPFEEIERDLLELSRADDAPVLRIAGVWRVKSPLELLHFVGGAITEPELDRFFAAAASLLGTADPALELPNNERWAASIHGKSRPHSNHLIEAIEDSLIRLSVFGSEIERLVDLEADARVRRAVRDLLEGADSERWLSLHGSLRRLAEAAPESFLDAAELSLTRKDQPILRLLGESSDGSLFSRCWHAELLWGLELLAWSPQYLVRATLILGALASVELPGNWGNSPMGSLCDIFVPWLPQTAAGFEERLVALDRLLEASPEAGWRLLSRLGLGRHSTVTPTARPRWRSYGLILDQRPKRDELRAMNQEIVDRIVRLAPDSTAHLAEVLSQLTNLPGDSRVHVLDAVEKAVPTLSDQERAQLQDAVRTHIAWHRRHDKRPQDVVEAELERPEAAYVLLAPRDPVLRHLWLFRGHLYELHERLPEERDYDAVVKRLAELQQAAIGEICASYGLAGVDRLLHQGGRPGTVGNALGKVMEDDRLLIDHFVVIPSDDEMRRLRLETLSGLFAALTRDRAERVGATLLDEGSSRGGWGQAELVEVLCCFPFDRRTWRAADELGTAVAEAYWVEVAPGFGRVEDGDREHALEMLYRARRPRTALHLLGSRFEDVASGDLLRILQQFVKGEEADAPLIDGWIMGEAITALEDKGECELATIAQLDFGLFPAVRHSARAARGLFALLSREPAVVADLIRTAYRRRDEAPDPVPKPSREVTILALDVLREFDQIPGLREDGVIEAAVLNAWVSGLRAECQALDRLEAADAQIGRLLAHSPVGEDGVWPAEPIRDTLDASWAENARGGFRSGTINNRGITSKAIGEGGNQERDLASKYRKYGDALRLSHPRLAATLDEVAGFYEAYGRREDEEARLREERYA